MGDYTYERLTPDRFQQFAAALLIAEDKNLQAFPIGHADGGRDIASFHQIAAPFAVYQVKHTRKIEHGKNYGKWLIDAIDDEMESITRLIDSGATEYTLVTNAPGTAPWAKGTIDKVARHLETSLPVPSRVIWRDDLDARIASQYDLKWAFPEVMASHDQIRDLVEGAMGNRRRERAINKYLSAQYEQDSTVKFKQAELQSTELLDLFVDVPGFFPAKHQTPETLRTFLDALHRTLSGSSSKSHGPFLDFGDERGEPGIFAPAGSALLQETLTQLMPRILVEGAPGQGKSTLAQYLAQVLRMRFLRNDRDLERLPAFHRSGPLRIPFKIDLRDLALWASGIHHRSNAGSPHGKTPSVESFIADEIELLSGGIEFTVDDLHEILSRTPTVLLLDGFDEIANESQRKGLVQEVERFLARVEPEARSIQTIVTSRPSVLAKSARFSRRKWAYVSLGAIDSNLALEYAARWANARSLDENERADLTQTLSEKLQLEHIRDLCRNPMQLTIMLWLLHSRGRSLPDQRTSLYANYVDVFFNREAEKAAIVRDNRTLLLDLHGYLAWRMHSDAESRGTNGRISSEDLKSLIEAWLHGRGHESDAIDELFQGVVQRIVALVSRTEGTFEFEVQPLREFFAARHLYSTSPYSPPGKPARGTKPDILVALLNNPYWDNVLRFFAGFYSAGEVPGLATELIDKIEAARGWGAIREKTVSLNLLGDWVTHQQPKWTERLTRAAIDELTLRLGSEKNPWHAAFDFRLDLPDSCGGGTVSEIAGHLLEKSMPHVTRLRVAAPYASGTSPDALKENWLARAIKATTRDGAVRELQIGIALRVTSRITPSEARSLTSAWASIERVEFLCAEYGISNALRDAQQREDFAHGVLAGRVRLRPSSGEWGAVRAAFDAEFLGRTVRHGGLRFAAIGAELSGPPSPAPGTSTAADLVECARLLLDQQASKVSLALADGWAAPLDALGRRESFLEYLLAAVAATARDRSRGKGASELFNPDRPLLDRVRYSRFRSSAPKWWRAQAAHARAQDRVAHWALLASVFTTHETFTAIEDLLAPEIDALPEAAFDHILSCVEGLSTPKSAVRTRTDSSERSLRWRTLLGVRGDASATRTLVREASSEEFDGRWEGPVAARVVSWAIARHDTSAAAWRLSAAVCFNLAPYCEDFGIADWMYYFPTRREAALPSTAVASRILSAPLLSSDRMILGAIARLAPQASRKPLAEVAAEQFWSTEPES
ncbi:NACHT domain-containing protein [Cellulosimicrobium funkei]